MDIKTEPAADLRINPCQAH